MSEDLTDYLLESGVRARYLHSEIDTLERIKILRDLRLGEYDVLVGVNLLREGLDLPEVSLVAILDADKEGFLRGQTALIQTIGRAARNVNGKVLMYADKRTEAIKRGDRRDDRRRAIQLAYNEEHGITPATIRKGVSDIAEFLVLQNAERAARAAAAGRARSRAWAASELEKLIVSSRRRCSPRPRSCASSTPPSCATRSSSCAASSRRSRRPRSGVGAWSVRLSPNPARAPLRAVSRSWESELLRPRRVTSPRSERSRGRSRRPIRDAD